jgi:hypothetical protein
MQLAYTLHLMPSVAQRFREHRTNLMVPAAAPFEYGSTPESAFRATPTHTERRTERRLIGVT